MLTPEQESSRRARNVAIGVTIALLAVLFYVVTIVKLGGGRRQSDDLTMNAPPRLVHANARG